MNHQIEIQNQILEYEHIISRRVRGLRLSIHPGGRVMVSAHPRITQEFIRAFILKKQTWIISKVEKMKAVPIVDPIARKREFQEYKAAALALAQTRVAYFRVIYSVRVGRISIKNHKTLWGSCSRRGNLNFNYKIAQLPSEYADYVVVHELCHLIEFNHSARFWALVAQTVPNHKEIRRKMRGLGMSFS